MRADALRGMGDIDGGREQLRQARTLAAATAPEIEGHVVQMQAFLEQLHGGLDEATRRYEEALGIHRAVGDGYRTGLALGQLATLLRIQGDVVGAIPGFLHAIAQLEAVQAVRAVANYQSELAAAYSTLGRFAEAEAELEAAVANCRLAGADRFELGCRSKLALLHATRGDFERAAGIREQLLAIWLDEGDETESAILRSSLAEAPLRLGHVVEALRGFEVSAAAFAHLKLSHYLTMNRLGACAAHRLVGNPTQARACLHEVASSPRVLDNLEAHPWALAEEGLLAEEPARAHACFVEATRRLETQPSHAASHAVWAWEALRERVFSDPEGS
jgi:tetratricopeptide (TPR) repeat protein